MKSVAKQTRYLRRVAYDGAPGLPRLRVMIALATAALAMPEQPRFLKQAACWLDLELVAQVLPDGGHVSRNPGRHPRRAHRPSPSASGLHRARPATVPHSGIRDRPHDADAALFRQGDGSFVHFNGMGDTANDQLATVLAYDDTRAAIPTNAPHSGYQRVEATDTMLVVDVGKPPPTAFSVNAHAGCSSFEMSTAASA